MSADKHRGLASRAAYLRLAVTRGGFAVNIRHAHPLTPFVLRMVDDGELRLRRVGTGGGKGRTLVHATPAGEARLEALERRFGPGFGSASDIGRVEPSNPPKAVRRRRMREEEPRHVLAAGRATRLAAHRDRMARLTAAIGFRLGTTATA